MQGDDLRRKPGSKFDSLAGDVAPAVDGNDRNGVLTETNCVDGNLASGEYEQGNPSALYKFRNQNDDSRDASDDCTAPG